MRSEEDEDTDRVSQEVVEVLRPSEVGGRGVHGGGRLAGEGGLGQGVMEDGAMEWAERRDDEDDMSTVKTTCPR